MTKKQPNLVTSTGALNLSDPAVVEHLKEISVTDVQPAMGLAPVEQKTEEEEAAAIQQEKEIQELEALEQKLEVSLSKSQVALLQREAKTLKMTTEQHLHNLIQERIFAKAVGRSIVSAPRIGGGKVLAPNHKVRTLSANAASQEKD